MSQISTPQYRPVEGILFSAEDRDFLAHIADQDNMLQHLLTLFGIGSIITLAPDIRIRTGKDLSAFLVKRAVDVTSPGWDSFFTGALKIMTSQMIKDIQIHLFQKNPRGSARQFFLGWLNYYTELRNRL